MNFIKNIALVGIIGLTAVVATPVMAAEGIELLTGKDCLACHKVDAKLVGPSYKDVAAKYKGDAEAPAKLVAKIKSGGSGNWGTMPMVPHPTIPDEELKKIVAWILSLS